MKFVVSYHVAFGRTNCVKLKNWLINLIWTTNAFLGIGSFFGAD